MEGAVCIAAGAELAPTYSAYGEDGALLCPAASVAVNARMPLRRRSGAAAAQSIGEVMPTGVGVPWATGTTLVSQELMVRTSAG